MTDATDNLARGEKIKPPRGSILTPLINTGTFYSRAEWEQQHQSHLALADHGAVDLLLLGDSILYGWNWPGRPELWRQYFGHFRTANLAISGDYIQHLLWRIENGNLSPFSPQLIILLIGANNLDEYEPAEINKGVMKIMNRLKRLCPESSILLTGLFPRGQMPDDPMRARIIQTNDFLRMQIEPGRVFFDDPGPELLNPDGSMSKRMFYDWCHPNIEGYKTWALHLVKRLNEMHIIPRSPQS